MGHLSPYLTAIVFAWIIAQSAKFLIVNSRNRGPIDFRQLYRSGSMPSSHSAAAVALTTVIGCRDGTDNGLFAITLLFAAIVMYDAVMVRRSAGEQGTAIQALIKEFNSAVRFPRAAKGHEPKDVAVGALIGFSVGILVFFLSH